MPRGSIIGKRGKQYTCLMRCPLDDTPTQYVKIKDALLLERAMAKTETAKRKAREYRTGRYQQEKVADPEGLKARAHAQNNNTASLLLRLRTEDPEKFEEKRVHIN